IFDFLVSGTTSVAASSPPQPASSSIETINEIRLPRLPNVKVFIVISLGAAFSFNSELYASSGNLSHKITPQQEPACLAWRTSFLPRPYLSRRPGPLYIFIVLKCPLHNEYTSTYLAPCPCLRCHSIPVAN